jgi:hypothetical protein
MAVGWGWSESRVRRFLKRLKTDAMIDAATDAGVTVITICNYNRYQRVSLPSDAATDARSDTVATQQRRKLEDREYKEEQIDVADEAPAKPSSGRLTSPAAHDLTEQLLVLAGHDPAFWPPGWATAAMRVQSWLNEGWAPEIITATVKAVAARKNGAPAASVNFFEKAIAEEVARQARPLPVVNIKEGETINVQSNPSKTSGGSLVDAARRNIAAGIAFGPKPTGLPARSGPDEGALPVRLLSAR